MRSGDGVQLSTLQLALPAGPIFGQIINLSTGRSDLPAWKSKRTHYAPTCRRDERPTFIDKDPHDAASIRRPVNKARCDKGSNNLGAKGQKAQINSTGLDAAGVANLVQG
jgi:hypothetical protein